MGKKEYRIIIPDEIDEMITLSELIVAKNKEDGESSVLSVIDMADMEAKTIIAKENHELAFKLNGDKEIAYEHRDHIVGIFHRKITEMPGTLIYYIRSCRDVLLGAYKDSRYMLGDFGFELLSERSAIKIPTKVPLIIDLAKKIIKKHKELGESSPLKGINMADFESKTNTAEEKNNLAPELKRQRNNYYVIRNQTLGIYKGRSVKVPGTLLFYITSVRDVLLGVFKTTETELGSWGFEVNRSRKGMSGKVVLSGKITDESGKSVPSVLVCLDEIEKSVRTFKSGVYNFRKVEKGIYTVRCIKNLFKTKIVPDVEIKEGECTTLDMVMEDSDSSICIFVYYENNVFEGAVVKLLESGEEKISDEKGYVIFDKLKAGNYTILISAEGKSSETLKMKIDRGTGNSISSFLYAVK